MLRTVGMPRMSKTYSVCFNGCTHDEILLEAPSEATDEVALTLKRTIEETGSVFLKTVPVEGKVVVVDSWVGKWYLFLRPRSRP